VADRIGPYDVGERAGIREIVALDTGKPLRAPEGDPLETGLMLLDHAIGGGLRPKRLVTIGARSGYGKSALAEQIALQVSKRARTMYLGLELGRERTIDRMFAKVIGTDVQSARRAMQHPSPGMREQFERLTYDRNLVVEERKIGERFTLDTALLLMNVNHPKVVIIDHMRHLDDWLAPASAGQRGDVPAALVARRLAEIAYETNITIIAVHQAKNALQGSRPTQHDLADTAALAQHSDHVWMIHRPFRSQGLRDTIAEVVVDKNREGPECLLHFEWTGRLMRYRDMMPGDEESLTCCKAKRTQTPRYDQT